VSYSDDGVTMESGAAKTITVTNAHEALTTSVEVTKVWDDDNNADLLRPNSIAVVLYADGTPVARRTIVTPADDETTETTIFKNLPMNRAGSQSDPIEYTVNEQPVEEYETEIVGTTITNKLIKREPKKETLKGKKTWNDKNNEDGKRPSYITVRLYCNGEEVASRMVTAATNWEYEFKDQIVDDGYGNKYSYKLEEDPVEGYFSQVKGLNVKNTRLPEKPSEPGKKRPPSYRKTGTPPPKFRKLREEELDELLDLFEYETPLWGGLLGTGDDTPVWPYAFAGAGVLALAALAVLDRRRRKAR
jgi:hypothetical protein